jgi:hypothetical protein
MENNIFETLNKIDVKEYIEHKKDKNGKVAGSFLPWAIAWKKVKEVYPDANYNIWRNENGLPYVYDENTGYMVFTDMTINNLTYSMWLPVMNEAYKAMKSEPYEYKTKTYTATVNAATMFDVNKTIMRCLVKNLAMFGLGLDIYTGEDLETEEIETIQKIETPKVKVVSPATITVEEYNALSEDNKNKIKELIAKKTGSPFMTDTEVIEYIKNR